jgi:hypothetical protein
MIYGVKIYDGEGNLKKVVEQKSANKLFWSEFYLQGGDYHNRGVDVDPEMLEQRGRKITCANLDCKKEAMVIGKRTRYCSTSCKTKHNNNRFKKTKKKYETICGIKTCDNVIMTTGKQKFCSLPCRRLANVAKNRRANVKAKTRLAQRKLELAQRQ